MWGVVSLEAARTRALLLHYNTREYKTNTYATSTSKLHFCTSINRRAIHALPQTAFSYSIFQATQLPSPRSFAEHYTVLVAGILPSNYLINPTMELEMGLEQRPQRKLRLLGLHGFRTSGDILRRQLSKWAPSLHELFDVDCIDAPLPCAGKSDVEGIFDGPFYEWFRFNKDFTEFYHMDEMFSYITDYMKLHGPYDGFLGFSQGAIISGCLAGLQEKGLALQDVPPIRLIVLIAPAQLRAPHLKHVYEGAAIKCPTLAFLGNKDWLRFAGEDVLKSFENSVTINHRFGHTVPRLDEVETATVAEFFKSQLANIDGREAVPKGEEEVPHLTFKAVDKIENVDLLNTIVLTNSRNEDVYVTA